MRAVMIMFDSLNRRFLDSYNNTSQDTKNFTRLAEHSVQFERFYVGSLPCIPARRELHTGRYNFLHRGWGPLEPFDDSMPELCKKEGIYTHLVTDHKHYWRDGGSTYHNRYNSYEFIRGQEGDTWIGQVKRPQITLPVGENKQRSQRKYISRTQDIINRQYLENQNTHTLIQTMEKGIEFIQTNHQADHWFLQIECFDPHEPFYVPEQYLQKAKVKNIFDGWPQYGPKDDNAELEDTIINTYRATIMMCDDYLGMILDQFDELNLWDDTLLMVCTDHGFLLGEHQWWGKNLMPVYDEIANTPFFLWDPISKQRGTKYNHIAQTIDIPATILDFFDIQKPQDMQGISLLNTLQVNKPIKELALYGYFGCNVNITDGIYSYSRAPVSSLCYEYTLMPMRINRLFTPDELSSVQLVDPLVFTKGVPILRLESQDFLAENYSRFGHRLYNLVSDPKQLAHIENIDVEVEYVNKMRSMMIANGATIETLRYYGLEEMMMYQDILQEKKAYNSLFDDQYHHLQFDNLEVKHGFLALLRWLKQEKAEQLLSTTQPNYCIDASYLWQCVDQHIPEANRQEVQYFIKLNMRIT